MRNKINLVSGETYTLSELFSGKRRIIIPDLQRDYCWGLIRGTTSNKKTDYVANFVESLVQYSAEPHLRKLNIGIVYGYELPINHVQLCDGQQRITTLYLLIGMLNRRLGGSCFAHHLATDEALREPYLQYAIRESSLYFLRDLLNNIFLVDGSRDAVDIDDIIKKSDWYFGDYDYDPSVQSMIGALVSIENVLSDFGRSKMESLGRFLLDALTFMYYDLENRRNGEETFVVINTTGEPLSSTEHLKPLAITAEINKDYNNLADDWEEIETWFWKKRKNLNGNDTADVGFHEFLRWVALLDFSGAIKSDETAKNDTRVQEILSSQEFVFPVNEIAFADVYTSWKTVKFLFDEWELRNELESDWLSPKDGYIAQINCFKLLPLVAWLLKHNSTMAGFSNRRNLIRMHRFFENIARLEDVKKSVNEIFCDAINLAVKYDDIVDAATDTSISNSILTKEEKQKLRILALCGDKRKEIEEAFWNAQYDEILSGEIWPLLNWSTVEDTFDFELFQKYTEQFHSVFHPKVISSLDVVRRALLAYDLKNYPVKNGGKNLSFCRDGWQWKEVISANSNSIRAFLDELARGIDLQTIIDRCKPSSKWFDIARDGFLLDYCEKKNVQEDQTEGILLIKSIRATTYVPLKKLYEIPNLQETRVRFGAEGIEYFADDKQIGFHRTINGHVWFFQRWLNPKPGEGDLYLMEDGYNKDSYWPGNNPNGETDLEKYQCLLISDTLSTEDIMDGMKHLIAECGTEKSNAS